jgi:hypothetical protein
MTLSGPSTLRHHHVKWQTFCIEERRWKATEFFARSTVQEHHKPNHILFPKLPQILPRYQVSVSPTRSQKEKVKPQNRSPRVITFLPFSDHVRKHHQLKVRYKQHRTSNRSEEGNRKSRRIVRSRKGFKFTSEQSLLLKKREKKQTLHASVPSPRLLFLQKKEALAYR